MIHVPHQSHKMAGNAISARYLASCRRNEKGKWRYTDVDYQSTFHSSGADREMKAHLCRMQNGLCCYCMRRVEAESPECTIEHIIPQSFLDEKQFEPYRQMGYPNLERAQVISTNEFCLRTPPALPPYPHTVAYQNMVMSCGGSFLPEALNGVCCNNYRGAKKINPLYLRSDAALLFEYTIEGQIIPNKSIPDKAIFTAAVELIQNARLQYTELTEIRHIWFMASRAIHLPLTDVNQKSEHERKKWLLGILLHGKELFSKSMVRHNDLLRSISDLASSYAHSIRWATLMAYDWFYSYYSNKF